jgi:hypothetical protein
MVHLLLQTVSNCYIICRANGKYAKKEHIHRMKPARLKRGRLNLQTLVILQSVELRCNQVGAGKNA